MAPEGAKKGAQKPLNIAGLRQGLERAMISFLGVTGPTWACPRVQQIFDCEGDSLARPDRPGEVDPLECVVQRISY